MLAVIRIWGLINSGTRWIQAFRGGSKVVIPMPDSLVLDITGPGSIRASRGSSMLAQLSGGRIIMPHTNVLYSGEFVLEITSSDGIVILRTWQVKPRFFVTHRREKEGRRREEGARLRQGRETS